LTLTDIAQGTVALVDEHEGRRTTIERFLVALKIRRLEIRRSATWARRRRPYWK
jgi:hypothetical protein